MEDAAARRDRLRALRAAKDLLSTPDAAAQQHQNGNREATTEQAEHPTLPGPLEASKENITPSEESEEVQDDGDMPAMKFRNYLPHDEQLRGGKLAPVSLPKFEDPISAETAEPKQLEI
ncbi:hypothetical protein E2562_014449 [Oryza meyeriana var. granulata]|uniref:Uncharacterized protein n=1 Tax=Oryza meyeriana var. granulata TaxID=110450 RepID=A0A6G1CQ37_9ORYZ|nr:hypothetical protein E2562_014449 [Oryza meyeriana var. granulata]